jgi:hypothetical protein
MLDITRILTEKRFRNEVLQYVEDPVVRNFWTVEFASWNDKFAAEAVAPVLNKVGAFTANPLVRNIIGQPKSSFNIRQIMDERKILIVNLSRGLVGEDNASLLGALLVTKIQLAAMSRADIPADQRSPFYLYVDEFQNFATDSFATILSEARKYGLNLTVANQYIAQMPIEVKDAVFGNVGSIISFRMGADDARVMQRYFEPQFLEYDLVHMHNRHFVISMTIEGEKVPGFSAISLNLPPDQEDYSAHIVQRSRASYGVSREFVDRYVHERYLTDAPKGANHQQQQKQQQARPPQQRPAVKQAAQPAPAEQKPAPQVATVAPASIPEVAPQPSAQQAAAPAPVDNRPATVQPAEALADGEEAPKPKRKRTRKRKKKTPVTAGENPTEQRTDRPSPAESRPADPAKKPSQARPAATPEKQPAPPQDRQSRPAPGRRPENPASEPVVSGEIISGSGTIHLK